LLCLAILNPKTFNLITEAPSQTGARTLKLVASSLIKLANLVEAKEPYMEIINPFIKENQQRMVMFLDELSNVPEVNVQFERPATDLARSLATIHQICVSHLEELTRMSQTQPFIKKLVTVTDMLTNHKIHYMGTNA
jgi:Ras GTPase-activating protein 1